MIARGITPILNVADLDASFAWFESLGWRKLWDWGEPPGFGSVGSGECEIFLCRECQGGRATSADDGVDSGVWMTVWVDDVDEVHRSCLNQGLDVIHPPTDEPWGVREMHLRHPDGHVFRISCGQAADDHPHPHPH